MQRQIDLEEFAAQAPLKSVFGCWLNPRTGRHNRLGGRDILIIDDIQVAKYGKGILSASSRAERLQMWEKKNGKYVRTKYYKDLIKNNKRGQ